MNLSSEKFSLTTLLLIALFMLSVLIRLPHIDRPLSKHHEFCTALALITFDVWEEHGAAKFHYSPVTNYQNPPDLHINNGTIPFLKNGTHYYLSHPPMGFWLPYFSLKTLGFDLNAKNLQYFNVLFHLLAALCVFSIVNMLLNKRENGENKNISLLFSPAILATSVYLFSPAMLWYSSNVYFSDIFVNQLFVISAWMGIKLQQSHRQFLQNNSINSQTTFPKSIYLQLLAFSLLVGMTLLTEWIGFMLAASVALYAFVQLLKFSSKSKPSLSRKFYGLQLVSMILVILAGLGITYGVYSSIAGSEAFLEYLEHRFLSRTGTGQVGESQGIWAIWSAYLRQLPWHFFTSYLPILLLLFGLLFLQFFKIRPNQPPQKSSPFNAEQKAALSHFWWLILPPILGHYFLFINYAAVHEYAVVKMSLPLSVCVAILYHQIFLNRPSFKPYLTVIFCLVFWMCWVQHYYINRLGDYSLKGERYDVHKRLGAAIRAEAQPDEMVFVKGKADVSFLLVYYAKRNIWIYRTPEKMEKDLEAFGNPKYRIFDVD